MNTVTETTDKDMSECQREWEDILVDEFLVQNGCQCTEEVPREHSHEDLQFGKDYIGRTFKNLHK